MPLCASQTRQEECPLDVQYCGSKQDCHLAPSHYLNHCLFIIGLTIEIKWHRYCNRDTLYIIVYEFENTDHKMVGMYSWPQCVKDWYIYMHHGILYSFQNLNIGQSESLIPLGFYMSFCFNSFRTITDWTSTKASHSQKQCWPSSPKHIWVIRSRLFKTRGCYDVGGDYVHAAANGHCKATIVPIPIFPLCDGGWFVKKSCIADWMPNQYCKCKM